MYRQETPRSTLLPGVSMSAGKGCGLNEVTVVLKPIELQLVQRSLRHPSCHLLQILIRRVFQLCLLSRLGRFRSFFCLQFVFFMM